MKNYHGERVGVSFNVDLPINICNNPECQQEFILLFYKGNGLVWEQVANVLGIYCPYCGKEIKY